MTEKELLHEMLQILYSFAYQEVNFGYPEADLGELERTKVLISIKRGFSTILKTHNTKT